MKKFIWVLLTCFLVMAEGPTGLWAQNSGSDSKSDSGEFTLPSIEVKKVSAPAAPASPAPVGPRVGATKPAPATKTSTPATLPLKTGETQALRAQYAAPGNPLASSNQALDQKPLMDPAIASGGSGRKGTIFVGAAAYFLKPNFNGNQAFTATTGVGANTHQEVNDFNWNYHVTPAFWVGWLNENGWGVRGHYFFFDQDSQTSTASLNPTTASTGYSAPPTGLVAPVGTPTFSSPGVALGGGIGQDNMTFSSNLRIQAIDLEATHLITGSRWWAMISGGGRYLHLSENYAATLSNVSPNVSESQLLQFGHNFNGGGPTMDLFLDYQLGSTAFSLFGDVRGSLLVGTAHSARNFVQVVNDPNNLVGGNQSVNPTANSSVTSVMPIVELELGVQYSLWLGKSLAFFRAGVVDQTYFGAGGAAQTGGNLSLFGGQISTGFLY